MKTTASLKHILTAIAVITCLAASTSTSAQNGNGHVNPFLQVGKDSGEVKRLQDAKDAQQKRDNVRQGKQQNTPPQQQTPPTHQTQEKKTTSATVNAPTNYFAGEDKYLKVMEANHRYDSFEVYNINNLDKKHAVVGLLTNTLPREQRYSDKGKTEEKITMSTGFVDKVDNEGKVVTGGQVPISSISFNDKIFVIIGNDDYRYLDGKKIVGQQQMVKELLKGKPITPLTFFYELQSAGILDTKMTYKQFSELSLAQKLNLVSAAQ